MQVFYHNVYYRKKNWHLYIVYVHIRLLILINYFVCNSAASVFNICVHVIGGGTFGTAREEGWIAALAPQLPFYEAWDLFACKYIYTYLCILEYIL